MNHIMCNFLLFPVLTHNYIKKSNVNRHKNIVMIRLFYEIRFVCSQSKESYAFQGPVIHNQLHDMGEDSLESFFNGRKQGLRLLRQTIIQIFIFFSKYTNNLN